MIHSSLIDYASRMGYTNYEYFSFYSVFIISFLVEILETNLHISKPKKSCV